MTEVRDNMDAIIAKVICDQIDAQPGGQLILDTVAGASRLAREISAVVRPYVLWDDAAAYLRNETCIHCGGKVRDYHCRDCGHSYEEYRP